MADGTGANRDSPQQHRRGHQIYRGWRTTAPQQAGHSPAERTTRRDDRGISCREAQGCQCVPATKSARQQCIRCTSCQQQRVRAAGKARCRAERVRSSRFRSTGPASNIISIWTAIRLGGGPIAVWPARSNRGRLWSGIYPGTETKCLWHSGLWTADTTKRVWSTCSTWGGTKSLREHCHNP